MFRTLRQVLPPRWMLITLFMMAAHVFARQLDRRTPSGRRMPDGVASIGVGTATT